MEYYAYANLNVKRNTKNPYEALSPSRKNTIKVKFTLNQDNASNILQRNYLSIEESNPDKIKSPAKNFYIKIEPVNITGSCGRVAKSSVVGGNNTYVLEKKKIFINGSRGPESKESSKEEYRKRKFLLNSDSDNRCHDSGLTNKNIRKSNSSNLRQLKQQEINFDRNSKDMRKVRPNYRNPDAIEHDGGSFSQDSPEWFKLYDKKKLSEINDKYVNNHETLHILSKFNRWITVTPSRKDRNRPLEAVKLKSLENSKIVPDWMQVNTKIKSENVFKPVQIRYYDKGAKFTVLMDKDQSRRDRFYN